MKIAGILLIIGIVASITQAEINLTEEQKKKLYEHHKACAIPSRDEEFAKRLISGDFVEDDEFKKYLFCITKQIAFQNDAGEINRDLIIEKLRKSIEDPAKAEEYIDTCLKNKSDSPTETTFKVIVCIMNIDPTKISLLST